MLDIFYTVFKYKEKTSPDVLGLYPERIHTAAKPERRYLWSSRMLVIIGCLSICLNIILSSTMILLLPQRGASPRLLHVNPDFSTLELTQPSEIKANMTDLVAEENINKYIILRHNIVKDYDELMARWAVDSTFYWLSSPTAFQEFDSTEKKNSIAQFRSRGLRREVEVIWTKSLNYDLWQSQFLTYDYYPDQKDPVVNIWRSSIRIAYEKIPFKTKADMVKNPYGFVVQSYSLSYIGKPEQSGNYLKTTKNIKKENYK